MKTAWEKIIAFVDKNVAIEADKYNDGYKNQYDEWLDAKSKIDSIGQHLLEMRQQDEMYRSQIRERDRILQKYGLTKELLK